MTDPHDHQSLSRIDLIVLARLSAPTAVTQDEIAKSLRSLGVPLEGAALTDRVTATLRGLEARTLVAAGPPKTKGKAKPRFSLTERGGLALRESLRLAATPSWTQMRDHIIPTLAVGGRPGPQATTTAPTSAEALVATLLRGDPALGDTPTVAQLCDQVIARALGMPPGPVTLAGIRAFTLATHCGIESKVELERVAARFASSKAVTAKQATKLGAELKALATTYASERLDGEVKTKPALVRALQRYWVSQQDEADAPRNATSVVATPAPPQHGGEILVAVREAIPMVGSAGRYGKTNVFVSALWQQVARDRRLRELSLAAFKHWLLTANRDQLVSLARADLVDDMDARLVEDSEIEDLGATFHFVIDAHATSGYGRVHHGG